MLSNANNYAKHLITKNEVLSPACRLGQHGRPLAPCVVGFADASQDPSCLFHRCVSCHWCSETKPAYNRKNLQT